MRQDEYNQGMERAMQRMHDDHMELRARLLRLRIAHLRRMSDSCLLTSMQVSSKLPRFPTEGQWKRFFAKQNRWSRFRTACRTEIARLRGER